MIYYNKSSLNNRLILPLISLILVWNLLKLFEKLKYLISSEFQYILMIRGESNTFHYETLYL